MTKLHDNARRNDQTRLHDPQHPPTAAISVNQAGLALALYFVGLIVVVAVLLRLRDVT
jgi:hypothetical protein